MHPASETDSVASKIHHKTLPERRLSIRGDTWSFRHDHEIRCAFSSLPGTGFRPRVVNIGMHTNAAYELNLVAHLGHLTSEISGGPRYLALRGTVARGPSDLD